MTWHPHLGLGTQIAGEGLGGTHGGAGDTEAEGLGASGEIEIELEHV